MKDRIKMIMEDRQMSQKEFALFTGISEGSLSGVFNERTRPTLQMIESIHECLPNISVEWIMFGTGPMYTDDNRESKQNQGVNSGESSSLLDIQTNPSSPSLFSTPAGPYQPDAGKSTPNVEKTLVKYIDKPERKITEIRIFYDDQTWETFLPKR
jgi:transcriptional regulator with XRE-family HTH domain